MRKIFTRASLSLVLLGAVSPLRAQVDPAGGSGASNTTADNGAMIAPAPVSGEGYSLEFASETPRTNFLSGGLSLGVAYGNGIVSAGTSDVSYSISPMIALNQTRSRLRWDLSYNPGFTFYQKYSSLNQASHLLDAKFSYRLTPHVTFSAGEAFSRTLGSLTNPCQNASGSLCGTIQAPNDSILAPNADTITDSSSAQLTYQFSPGGMVGLTGNFSERRYPDQGAAPGLSNSNAAGGGAFYTHRVSGRHYVGATYQYQKYLTTSNTLLIDARPATLAQSVMFFYTFYLQRSISFSLFAGPQYSDSYGGGLPRSRSWSPGGGGSINWEGQHTSLVASYSRRISDGGGLQGAVSSNGTDATIRHRFTPTLNGALGADYTVNKVLDATDLNNTSGHTISGNVSLQRSLGEHFGLTAGYLRQHQSYDIAAINSTPNRDRVWLSISYQFQKALGR